ncbi:leucine-rich repeat protein [Naegleria gruberi]|uniref:Leucine-rich repeat protein n=1 Tax=Naegleria gruberi TaxID=5762 RepID=D2VZ66_NAEGR|nr:leucine-rich repeat protein [Naegleria gruberi]EFC37939.1 leucine-rich repeat protein [Naegleria gruberi]|eukprot:XP_002670683.1 leucine-rich repeat protein [Naegleria gruberi strain NEG-M]
MNKRIREDITSADILISENNSHSSQQEAKKTKLSPFEIFSDDVIYEILNYHRNDFIFMVMNCALVSKQWLNVISERLKFSLVCGSDSKMQGQFLQNIENLKVRIGTIAFELFDCRLFGLMKHLTQLDVSVNLFTFSQAKLIGELAPQLTNLNISHNTIGVYGAKHISKLKHLTILNISGNLIGQQGAKAISNLEYLTELNISNNSIFEEGVKFIGEMKQLRTLDIHNNMIEEKGVEHLTQLEQLTKLDISNNSIGANGVKYLTKMKQLTILDVSYNRIDEKEFYF